MWGKTIEEHSTKRKKSYHSITVPTMLAKAMRFNGVPSCACAFGIVLSGRRAWMSGIRRHRVRCLPPDVLLPGEPAVDYSAAVLAIVNGSAAAVRWCRSAAQATGRASS
ncbi:hypothetical protein GCM10022420_027980 [Streptomyces iranensis]